MPVSRLSGVVKTARFRVAPGDTVLLDGPLDIRSTGDVVVIGDIRADARTPPGSGIKITSARGNIIIRGRIEAAPGAAGQTPPVGPVVVAGPGSPGGAIEIVAAAGSLTLLRRGVLQSGAGGWGGNATARGTGAQAQLIKAVSGAGAPAGKISLAAADLLSLEGTVRGGEGGWGGEAIANGDPTQPPPPLPDPHPDQPRPNRPPRPTERPPKPPPPGYPAVVEATGLAGGPGGDIEISMTGNVGIVGLDGTVCGGTGGSSNEAIANGVQADALPGTGARRAQALLEAGGRGGNGTITLEDSLWAAQTPGQGELRGGNGGDAGDRSSFLTGGPMDPPLIFIDGATATASEVALAWVGHPLERGKPAGGAIGTVTATAHWRGPPEWHEMIILTIAPSFAGDACGAVAKAGAITKNESDSTHNGATPGRVRRADAP